VVVFDNETGNSDLDRYAQNVTDTLVTEMTTGAGGRLRVIGNAAELRVPRSQCDLVPIGRSLHAGYIVLVTATDPATYVGISTLLLLVAIVACLIPTRRASRCIPQSPCDTNSEGHARTV
jgi:ABC-type lipoprotein release transport system permease subunit